MNTQRKKFKSHRLDPEPTDEVDRDRDEMEEWRERSIEMKQERGVMVGGWFGVGVVVRVEVGGW